MSVHLLERQRVLMQRIVIFIFLEWWLFHELFTNWNVNTFLAIQIKVVESHLQYAIIKYQSEIIWEVTANMLTLKIKLTNDHFKLWDNCIWGIPLREYWSHFMAKKRFFQRRLNEILETARTYGFQFRDNWTLILLPQNTSEASD